MRNPQRPKHHRAGHVSSLRGRSWSGQRKTHGGAPSLGSARRTWRASESLRRSRQRQEVDSRFRARVHAQHFTPDVNDLLVKLPAIVHRRTPTDTGPFGRCREMSPAKGDFWSNAGPYRSPRMGTSAAALAALRSQHRSAASPPASHGRRALLGSTTASATPPPDHARESLATISHRLGGWSGRVPSGRGAAQSLGTRRTRARRVLLCPPRSGTGCRA